jgi:hypothetical protein
MPMHHTMRPLENDCKPALERPSVEALSLTPTFMWVSPGRAEVRTVSTVSHTANHRPPTTALRSRITDHAKCL